MLKINELDTETAARFFAPLEDLYPDSQRQYHCTSLSDLDFAVLGILRCLSAARTGREFLQHHADHGGRQENPDLFFKALKSKRRLENLVSLNDSLAAVMSERIADPLAGLGELKGYHFFAADGHYHAASCHEPAQVTATGTRTQRIATGHFFRVNLRTHHVDHLDVSRPKDGKKKDHDANVIRRVEVGKLRHHARTGEKVVYFWDKACIDYATWSRHKQRGIYFVTREKSNSALRPLSVELFESADPRNEGILSDVLVGGSNGETLRRVIYCDPRDNKTYTYITNELNLPAWAIALGYKHRWDIEKIFDQFKNKMMETKSWAAGSTAKESHAVFQCLAHNLSLIFEEEIKEQEGLEDRCESRTAEGRRATRTNREGQPMQAAANFINRVFQRATQRTVRFLRWLRAWLYQKAPWHRARARLAHVWGCSE
jgi:hypothetical protein